MLKHRVVRQIFEKAQNLDKHANYVLKSKQCMWSIVISRLFPVYGSKIANNRSNTLTAIFA